MRGKHGNHVKASDQHRWKPGSRVGSTGHVKVRADHNRLHNEGRRGPTTGRLLDGQEHNAMPGVL